MRQHICVIGAGLAGLACALAAALRGSGVKVLDEAPQMPSLPAHIEIVPSMLRDLAAFGVADACVRAGFAFHGIDVMDRHGRHLHELPTDPLAGPRWPAALGMRHDDLRRVLEDAVREQGARVQRACRVREVRTEGDAAHVILDNGDTLATDLVLLATGACSPLRRGLFPQAALLAQPRQFWCYALLPRQDQLDRPLIAFGEAGQRAVLVPASHDQVGLAVTSACAEADACRRPAQVRGALQTFAPRLRKWAGLLGDDVRVAQRPVYGALLPAPWHQGRVLAVGDSAHALPPHLGQAAAQAIEDARVLFDLLPQHGEPRALFEAFEQRRAARVREVHDITTTAARWDVQPDPGTDLGQLMQRLTRALAEPA